MGLPGEEAEDPEGPIALFRYQKEKNLRAVSALTRKKHLYR
jgi:hypothetical protein